MFHFDIYVLCQLYLITAHFQNDEDQLFDNTTMWFCIISVTMTFYLLTLTLNSQNGRSITFLHNLYTLCEN